MVCKSQIKTYRCYPEFEGKESGMQFRLTYEGPLRPSGNNTSYGTHKHEIRRAFHPQLKRLWETDLNLRQIGAADYDHFVDPSNDWRLRTKERRTILQALADDHPLQDYRFVPLVSKELSLSCGLDILFLRYGVPGDLLRNGDIDNRVHTLIDALQRPTHLQEIGTPYTAPRPSEHPFFVLLENDALVSKLAVETDNLLEPLAGGIPEASDARVVITVTVRPTIATYYNLALT